VKEHVIILKALRRCKLEKLLLKK